MTRAALAYKMHFLETSVAVQSENKSFKIQFQTERKEQRQTIGSASRLLGYILAFFLYMVLMWAILRRTGCLQRKHLVLLGLFPLIVGVSLVGIVTWKN